MRRSKVSPESLSIPGLWLVIRLSRDHVCSPTRSPFHGLERSMPIASFGCLQRVGHGRRNRDYVSHDRDLRISPSATADEEGMQGCENTILKPWSAYALACSPEVA
jgi:hypothetical protein